MAYLFFRTDDRLNHDNGRHEYAGDLVGFLPDNHLTNGGDFGRKGRREFVWVRVIDCPDDDMLRGLCAEESPGKGRRRRFTLNRLALRTAAAAIPRTAAAAIPMAWHDAAWNRATDVAERECPTIAWSAIAGSCRDRETGRKPHERRLVEHFNAREVERITKEIDDDARAGKPALQSMHDERAVAMAKRDAARTVADRDDLPLVVNRG